MFRSSRRLLLALTALLALAGCQLTDIEKGDCQSGDTKCIAGNIYACDARGRWSKTPTTECGESGCSEGTIQPANTPLSCFECGVDEAECNGNDFIVCSNHRLSKTACDNGCMQTDTHVYCRECKDNELKCENGFIISCAKDGDHAGKWDDDHKQSCGENGCFPGARGNTDEVKCYECNTDQRKCISDDNTKVEIIKKCLAHNWYDDKICEFGCFEGIETECKECDRDRYFNNEEGYCVKQECYGGKISEGEPAKVSCNKAMDGIGECLNGSSRCFDKGNDQGAFQYCEDGVWKEFGFSCDPNDPCAILGNNKCIGSGIGQICSADGKSLIACPNNTSCKSDYSGCASCQNGTSKCDNNIILECIDGEYTETVCAPSTHCEVLDGKASCVTNECENGAQRCQGKTIQACENYQWKTQNACDESEQCEENDGVASCRCTSGVSYCDNNQIKRCNEGQWQTTACGINENCIVIGGKATCIECESGTKCQGDTQIMTCQNNAWSAATSCADGMKCTGASGSAKCVCTSGQAKCASDNTKIIKCKADGTYGSAESCGADTHCEGVAGSAICTADPMECSPGEKRCTGNDLQTCSSKGKWEKTQTCTKGCANMACNVCKGDEKICENGILKTCENGQWKLTSCGVGCYDNTQCNVCPPHITECKLNTLRTCLGNEWKEEKCAKGCLTENGVSMCKCTFGAIECVDPNNAKFCAKDGKWGNISCSGGCQNNVCKQCQPGVIMCENNHSLQCSDDGQWLADECKYGCNKKNGKCYPECTPDTKKCVEETVYKCDANGMWQKDKFCLLECKDGECNDPCIPGETQCEDKYHMSICVVKDWESIECPHDICDAIAYQSCLGGCEEHLCIQSETHHSKYLKILCHKGDYDLSQITLCNTANCNSCDLY